MFCEQKKHHSSISNKTSESQGKLLPRSVKPKRLQKWQVFCKLQHIHPQKPPFSQGRDPFHRRVAPAARAAIEKGVEAHTLSWLFSFCGADDDDDEKWAPLRHSNGTA